MARSITTGFQTEIEAQYLVIAVLIKASFDSGDLNLHSGKGDIVFDGDTYQGAGQLLGIGQVKETQSLEAVNLSFTLSGELASLVSLALTENPNRRRIKMWYAPLNQTTGQVISNPYEVYSGYMDTYDIERRGGTEAVITLNTEGELITYTIPRNIYYTDESQKARYEDDTGMSYVTLIQDISIPWGVARA